MRIWRSSALFPLSIHSCLGGQVRDFYTAVAEGRSCVKQMIMGAGKTTVVAPLLTLFLTDGKHLVWLVVPTALLEFTRTVAQQALSSVPAFR